MAANRKLAVVYVVKDDLKQLWDFAVHGHALRFWEQWYSRAVRSRIEPLKKFARNLITHLHEIISHCQWPLHTSLLEGINNKIKVLNRMAYGFRDDDYFFLKNPSRLPRKITKNQISTCLCWAGESSVDVYKTVVTAIIRQLRMLKLSSEIRAIETRPIVDGTKIGDPAQLHGVVDWGIARGQASAARHASARPQPFERETAEF